MSGPKAKGPRSEDKVPCYWLSKGWADLIGCMLLCVCTCFWPRTPHRLESPQGIIIPAYSRHTCVGDGGHVRSCKGTYLQTAYWRTPHTAAEPTPPKSAAARQPTQNMQAGTRTSPTQSSSRGSWIQYSRPACSTSTPCCVRVTDVCVCVGTWGQSRSGRAAWAAKAKHGSVSPGLPL